MILDLVEVKPKLNRIKLIIVFIVALLIVVMSIFAGIKLVNSHQRNQKDKENQMLAKVPYQHIVKFPVEDVMNEEVKQAIRTIYHSEEKRVFLTFDDGPSKSVTPLILDLLQQENIKTTFFTLGSRVELFPEIVKREYEEGHYVANHGYSHVYSQIYTSPETVLDEYNRTEEAIKNAVGRPEYSSHLFRFPGGSTGGKYAELKKQAICLLDENKIAHIDWNALTADAAGMHTKEAMLEYVKKTIGSKNSVIILMHDAGDKILTYEILPDLIAYLREQGYKFKSFHDIIPQ